MTSGEQMPKGGFLRGLIAGTALSGVLVVVLSTAFDTSRTASPLPEAPAVAGTEAKVAAVAPSTGENLPAAPAVSTESLVVTAPPQDPVDALPALGQGTAVTTTTAPAPISSTQQAATSPATQPAPAVPVTGAIQTTGLAVTDEAAPQLPGAAPIAAPATVENAPSVASPEAAAGVVAETETAVIAAPVASGNAGFAAPEAGAASNNSGLSGTGGGIPAVTPPTQLGNSDTGSAAPVAPEAAAKPATGFALNGQTLVSPSGDGAANIASPGTAGGAFASYAQSFDATTDKPAVAIVLLADNVAQVETAMALSEPVSIAVSADNPDAADIVSKVRSFGGEALIFLPPEGPHSLRSGTDPATAVASLRDSLASIPAVIGIVDGPDGDLPSDTRLLSAVLDTLDEQGFGVVTTTSIGLNRAEMMAGEAGIPAASIVRRIDSEPGKIPVIRQMDKAVLQIGDGNKTVVFGAASNDVLSALKFWMKSNKAQNVTVAPVSFTMK